MAARKGVALIEEHRQLVSAGKIGLAELADRLGVSRQTVHAGFKKRGWATKADVEDQSSTLSQSESTTGKAPRGLASAREPPTGVSVSPTPSPAPGGLPGASAPSNFSNFSVATSEDLVDAARHELANASLLAIAHARDLITKGDLGPAGLKSVVAAMSIAATQLAQCGFDLEASASHGVKALLIAEMTAEDVRRTQAEVEAAYHGDSRFDDPTLAVDLDDNEPTITGS